MTEPKHTPGTRTVGPRENDRLRQGRIERQIAGVNPTGYSDEGQFGPTYARTEKEVAMKSWTIHVRFDLPDDISVGDVLESLKESMPDELSAEWDAENVYLGYDAGR